MAAAINYHLCLIILVLWPVSGKEDKSQKAVLEIAKCVIKEDKELLNELAKL